LKITDGGGGRKIEAKRSKIEIGEKEFGEVPKVKHPSKLG
jgi:hypothetical protein